MHACTLRLGEKEQKGSTPCWSHPLQITICTRHLWTELSSWRENKQTENRTESGKRGPVLSGSLQVSCLSAKATVHTTEADLILKVC